MCVPKSCAQKLVPKQVLLVWKCGKSRPLYGKATIVIVSVLLLSHMLLDYTLYSVLKNYLVLSVHSFAVIKSFWGKKIIYDLFDMMERKWKKIKL
jgi:hypothetical protein